MEKTLTDEAELLAELVAVAVPVVPDETVIGACSVAGPRHRMDDEYLKEDVVELILSVVNEVELTITHSRESASRVTTTAYRCSRSAPVSAPVTAGPESSLRRSRPP